jgi:hypothetical protein
MRSRISFATATLVLAICLICQVTEIFDHWDHTLQSGDDTEYTFVVLALCVGVAYSLKWFVPKLTLPGLLTEAVFYPNLRPSLQGLIFWSPGVPIPASPPVTALRI